ncbi:PilW family protein [Thermodesulfobacteriota bacterium]
MLNTIKGINNENGFTLVELMVTVFLTAIAVISIYRGYTSFSQSADAQQQVIEMQQNLRVGMTRLVKDIRRAGMNEEEIEEAGFLCETAPTNDKSIEFSMDLTSDWDAGNAGPSFRFDSNDNDDDGDIDEEDESRIGDGDTLDDGESIKYYLVASTLDPTTNDLKRAAFTAGAYPANPPTLITNVDALDFVYFDEDGAELVPSVPTSGCTGLPAGTLTLWGDDLQDVERVEITLVVRATNEDFRYTNRETYRNLQGEEVWPKVSPHPADNFRRRAFTMNVQIRNNI